MRKIPSPWSVISTDAVSWAMMTGAPMVLFIGLAVKLTGTVPGRRGGPDRPVSPEVASLILAGAVAIILVLAAIMALRVARVRRLFDEGREVEASVRKVARLRGGTKLKLEFELEGIPYTRTFTFQRWWTTPEFSEGTRIAVVVDPDHPKRAVPLALYALYADPGTAQSGDRRMSAERSWPHPGQAEATQHDASD